jgi:hypothetical protein
MLRLNGSLIGMFSSSQPGSPGFSIEDWWTMDTGFGYVHGAKDGPWVHLRLGLAVRPLYTVSDQVQIFSRLGYMTGTGNNTHQAEFQGNGYDALFATAGTRVGSVIAEAGAGTHGYLLGRVAVRVGSGTFGWLGVRFERNDTRGDREYLVSLTAGTN